MSTLNLKCHALLPVFTDGPGLRQVSLELLGEDWRGVQGGVARVHRVAGAAARPARGRISQSLG